MGLEHHSCALRGVIDPKAALQLGVRAGGHRPDWQDLVADRHPCVSRNPALEWTTRLDCIDEFLPFWRLIKRDLKTRGKEALEGGGLVIGQDATVESKESGRFLELLRHLALTQGLS